MCPGGAGWFVLSSDEQTCCLSLKHMPASGCVMTCHCLNTCMRGHSHSHASKCPVCELRLASDCQLKLSVSPRTH